MVSDGLTPPVVGKTDPSQTQRLGMSRLLQSESTTLVCASNPKRVAMSNIVKTDI
jgi:hypothetical protein